MKKLLSFSILVLLTFSVQSFGQQKPNIIYILADDLGYGDVGFNGQDKIKTPNIDRLAAEGVIFTNHYSGSPVCGPSRSCLLTGMDTGHTTMRGNPGWASSGEMVVLKAEDITVAEELKRAAYSTGIFGKWGMDEAGTSAQANAQGFDEFFGYRRHGAAHHYYPKELWHNNSVFPFPDNITEETKGKYSHDVIIEKAFNFVDDQAKSKTPFFLYLAPTIPHYELTVPEDSKSQYLELGWEKRPMKKGHYYNDEEGNTTYAGMISRLDRDIGRLLDQLKALAIDKNTIVIFTSDNGHEYDRGFFNSNWKFKGRKRDTYEGGIHVPFAARWPEMIPAGTVSNHISAFWDFLPTVCDLVGIQPSSTEINGISYKNALLGEVQQAHQYLYWEFNEANGPRQALRKGDWKLIRYWQKEDELYNLNNDIGESTNLAHEFPEKLKELQTLLVKARTNDPNYDLVKLKRK
ncbi:Arylsulfatase A [Spirosomataceae bacterium TFI 002]|nr:Arylsulfatase A [Spirosomataceae bacterium TFI 002]